MRSENTSGRAGWLIVIALAVAALAIAAGVYVLNLRPYTHTLVTHTTAPAVFDPAAGAGGNTEWLQQELDRLAAEDGGGTTSQQVHDAVTPATDAGWQLELTGDETTLEGVRTDAIQVAVRDHRNVCLIGFIGTDDAVRVHVVSMLESTSACLTATQPTPPAASEAGANG